MQFTLARKNKRYHACNIREPSGNAQCKKPITRKRQQE